MATKQIVWILLLLGCTAAQAQSTNELWTKLNITKQAGEKLTIGADVQYRRQSGPDNDKNMLHYPLASSIRLSAIYQLKHNWQVVTFPIAFFSNQVWVGSTSQLRTSNDVRTAAGTAKSWTLWKIRNRNRLLYELTVPLSQLPQRTIRHRYRLQTSFSAPVASLSAKTSIRYNIVNEVFVRTISGATTFDQNRLFNAVEFRHVNSNIQVGYQWAAQQQGGSINNRNQLLINLNIVL